MVGGPVTAKGSETASMETYGGRLSDLVGSILDLARRGMNRGLTHHPSSITAHNPSRYVPCI